MNTRYLAALGCLLTMTNVAFADAGHQETVQITCVMAKEQFKNDATDRRRGAYELIEARHRGIATPSCRNKQI